VYKPKKEAGFSFIEVVFATAILSISVLGLMTLTITSIQSTSRTERTNDSIRLASEVAEVLLEAPFDAVQTCSLVGLETTNQAGATSSSNYNAANACLGVDFKLFPDPEVHSDETIGSAPGNTSITAAQKATVPYEMTWTVASLSDDLKQINIQVKYDDGQGARQHDVTIVKHREM
jgi:type II secretory pathway pseudopilin PulG